MLVFKIYDNKTEIWYGKFNSQKIILTHSRGFSFLTFLCALSSGSGDFTRIYSQRRTVRCALFTTLSLYPFHLSIPLSPSLSLSLSLPLSLSLSLLLSLPLSLSLSYLSLPLYIFPSTFLSLSFLLSLFSLSFSLAYLMDVFVLVFILISRRDCGSTSSRTNHRTRTFSKYGNEI